MSDETKAPTKSGAARKAIKRRAFSLAFKRKIVAEAARTSYPAVMKKYRLYSAVYEWKHEVGKAPPKAANGKAVQLGPTREAIIFLRQSERAFAEGKAKRGRLLSQLALSTLSGD